MIVSLTMNNNMRFCNKNKNISAKAVKPTKKNEGTLEITSTIPSLNDFYNPVVKY